MPNYKTACMDFADIHAVNIQRWWKKRTSLLRLRKVHNYLRTTLSDIDLQELIEK